MIFCKHKIRLHCTCHYSTKGISPHLLEKVNYEGADSLIENLDSTPRPRTLERSQINEAAKTCASKKSVQVKELS